MFGYIKPFKPMLRVCEFDTYKAIYCGLCKQLSRSYGPFARLTLSYDFTFLALLDMALRQDPPQFRRENCAFNPLKKRPCCVACSSLHFSASAAMLLLYYKLQDNLRDEGFPKKLVYLAAYPFAHGAWKKAREEFQELDGIVGAQMQKQALLEQNNCGSVDEASEPSACSLAAIFESLSREEGQRRVLYRLGYLMGRWIYLADALDDLGEDREKGRYNPFLIQNREGTPLEALRESAVSSLNMTIGEIIKTYRLLTLYRYDSILENVLALGLKSMVDQLARGETTPRGRRRI